MLTKYVNFFGGEWDEWLRELQYAYNSSVHTSTGFSPAELMYGRKLRIPLDIVYAYRNSDDSVHHDIDELRNNLSEIYEMVRKNMKVRQDTAAAYQDKKVIDDVLQINNDVLKWNGPYKIIRCRHPSYLISVQERGKLVDKWFTRDKLRRRENTLRLRQKNAGQQCSVTYDSSSDDSDTDGSEIDRSQSTPYNLRRDVQVPDRYGTYVTHFAEICGYSFDFSKGGGML